MELREFVGETLKQIIDGVSDAQAHAKTCNAAVSPNTMAGSEVARAASGLPLQTVELDIAITATSGTETSGGIGVIMGALNLGSKGASEKSDMTVSRVRFTVPIAFPPG